ncbi:MAG: hypothetical protein ACE5H2_00280 [Terriglobia bacterium]
MPEEAVAVQTEDQPEPTQAGHPPECGCQSCRRERKRLADEEWWAMHSEAWGELPSRRDEARGLLYMVGKNGDTVDTIRALIAVPPKVEAVLLAYAQTDRNAQRGIERVAEAFERLL